MHVGVLCTTTDFSNYVKKLQTEGNRMLNNYILVTYIHNGGFSLQRTNINNVTNITTILGKTATKSFVQQKNIKVVQ